ncbi:hypothetical protein ACWDX9_62080, partial [Nonomuraea sp. NPDC003201]
MSIDTAWPSGLPIGDGWVETAETDDVTFPYDGSLVATHPSPMGRPDGHAVSMLMLASVGRW